MWWVPITVITSYSIHYTKLYDFTYGDTPIPEALDGLVKHLLSQGETFAVSHFELAGLFDIRPLVVSIV